MKAGNKQLTKKEQNKIVTRTNFGGIPLSVGYNIGTKARHTPIKTSRKRG